MKRISILFLTVLLSVGLCACSKEESKIIENIDSKIALSSYEISGTLKVDDNAYNFEGVHSKDITNIKISKNDIVDYTEAYVNTNDIYLKNGPVVEDLMSTFGELEAKSSEYILINGGNTALNLQNINFNILYTNYLKAFRNVLNDFKVNNNESIVVENGLSQIVISEDNAVTFIDNVSKNMEDNVEKIYNEIIENAPKDMQNKYKTSSEKNQKKIKKFVENVSNFLEIGDGAVVEYKNMIDNNSIKEVINIKDNSKNISLSLKIVPIEEMDISLPTDVVNISEMEPLSKEEQKEQLDNFYSDRYPEAAKIKQILINLGYSEPKYSTSLNGISLYATREPKSIDIKYDIVDEAVIDVIDGWLSEVKLISCFSDKDYELYNSAIINSYIEEIEEIIDTEFLVEINDNSDYHEYVGENWEFYISLNKVNIDNANLVMIEIGAKQH